MRYMGRQTAFDRLYYNVSLMELRMMNRTEYRNARVSYSDQLYMDIIAFNEDCTVSRLSELMGISKSAVTQKVSSLEKRGLIERTRSPDDGRVNIVRPSKERIRDFENGMSVFDGVIAELSEKHTKEEMETFWKVMDSASDILEELDLPSAAD